MGNESIDIVLAGLPEKNVTVYTLRALDFVVPGEWQNIRSFDEMIQSATGVSDPAKRQAIAAKAKEIFANEETGFQRSLWLYNMTDKADAALGGAAMASKVGERINFLSFLNRLTPAADTTQSIDLALKITVELLCFCFMNGVPRSREGISEFVSSLQNVYRHESLMRMAALVCIDGIIPLGPDFVDKVGGILSAAGSGEMTKNPLFSTVGKMIPGDDNNSKFGFVTESFNGVRGWMNNLLQKRNLTTEKVTSNLRKFVQFTDDKLDYLAAFFDMSTNYYTHTGTQTVARYAIIKAQEQLDTGAPMISVPGAVGTVEPMAMAAPSAGGGDSQQGQGLYDYMAQSPGFLSFSKGESLTVKGGEQGGWCYASNATGQAGWVPATYVELGAASSPSAPAAPQRAVLTTDNYGSTLVVKAGETVTITGGERNGWYWGTTNSGQSGWIVASIVKMQ